MKLILKNILPVIILLTILLAIYRILDNTINHKKYKLIDFIYLIFIIYFLMLIYVVTCDGLLTYEPVNNLKPFKEILRYRLGSTLFIKNIIGNIILFVPFGLFFKLTFNLKKRYIFIITMIFCLSIELIQLLIGRVFDIDDIILNIIGSIIGSKLIIKKE